MLTTSRARVEVEYRWVLALDPAHSHLPVPSANARPLSAHTTQTLRNALTRPARERPAEGDPFCDPEGLNVWSEFATASMTPNLHQTCVDLAKPNTLWHYLGKSSTEARAHYTEDPRNARHNPSSNFLDLVKPSIALTVSATAPRRSYVASRYVAGRPSLSPLMARMPMAQSVTNPQQLQPLQPQASGSQIDAATANEHTPRTAETRQVDARSVPEGGQAGSSQGQQRAPVAMMGGYHPTPAAALTYPPPSHAHPPPAAPSQAPVSIPIPPLNITQSEAVLQVQQWSLPPLRPPQPPQPQKAHVIKAAPDRHWPAIRPMTDSSKAQDDGSTTGTTARREASDQTTQSPHVAKSSLGGGTFDLRTSDGSQQRMLHQGHPSTYLKARESLPTAFVPNPPSRLHPDQSLPVHEH